MRSKRAIWTSARCPGERNSLNARRSMWEPRAPSDVIYRRRGKGRVIDVRKGEYLLVPARAGIGAGWSESIFRAVDAVVREDYYVGFWSAMNYLGMTEQVPRVVDVVA